MDARYQGLLDMINGGGAGQAGETFQGGALSDLLNSLGIRPMGYRDRQAEQAPPEMLQPRISSMGAPAPMMPPQPSPYAPGAITQTTLPPMGQMSDEQLMQMIRNALSAPPTSLGYGPR